MKPLILASMSPRRVELLRQIGCQFDIIPSHVSEELPPGLDPASAVMELALRKARSVAANITTGMVIGADTVVVSDGVILGKPEDHGDAVRMLTKLSGKVHSVFTGLAVVDASEKIERVDYVETKVWFRKLDPEEIEFYVASGEPLDKAGAYGIQGLGAILVEKIDGCYFNVVGLPLSKLVMILRELGVSIAR
ncbi:MAG TPA: Maf family protein [Bacillota bacterium]|nr:Maf family protein [Bacillota bacterium]HPT88011.1 Maf family protein [Bacillota bacterium]